MNISGKSLELKKNHCCVPWAEKNLSAREGSSINIYRRLKKSESTGKSFRFVRACVRASGRGEAAWARERWILNARASGGKFSFCFARWFAQFLMLFTLVFNAFSIIVLPWACLFIVFSLVFKAISLKTNENNNEIKHLFIAFGRSYESEYEYECECEGECESERDCERMRMRMRIRMRMIIQH